MTSQLSKHFHDVFFGGNWTFSNVRDNLKDVTWQQATTKVSTLNTIAVLVYHINYFVEAQLKVLNGKPLDSHDKFSFDCPPIHSKEDWEKLIDTVLTNAGKATELIAKLPDSKLTEDFTDKKYGNYMRNILGIIEHTHYHLGQIAVIRKMLQQ